MTYRLLDFAPSQHKLSLGTRTKSLPCSSDNSCTNGGRLQRFRCLSIRHSALTLSFIHRPEYMLRFSTALPWSFDINRDQLSNGLGTLGLKYESRLSKGRPAPAPWHHGGEAYQAVRTVFYSGPV